MTNRWQGLAETVQKFKRTVKDELDKNNEEFHSVLNGDDPVSFYGLGSTTDERNQYMVEPSDVLFWHDPVAYLDELERWGGESILAQHKEAEDFLKSSDQVNIFNRLVESMKRGRIAPFVGAGLSFSCGYPLWDQALTEISKKLEGISSSEINARNPSLPFLTEIKHCIEQRNYIEAAELLYVNHKTQLTSFISNKFDGAKQRELSGPIQLLPKFSSGCIITTNFDQLIERIFEKDNMPISGYMHGTQSQNQFASKLIQGDRCILKLHGDYNSAETYIFSKSQYSNAYGEDAPDYTKPLARVLRQIFISHSLLFLGCSLDKDRTIDVFKDVVSSNAFDVPEHYALLPIPEHHHNRIDKENFLDTVRIKPIWYAVTKKSDGISDHSLLEKILHFAIECSSGAAALRR